MTNEEKIATFHAIEDGVSRLVGMVPIERMREANAAWDDIATAVKSLKEKA